MSWLFPTPKKHTKAPKKPAKATKAKAVDPREEHVRKERGGAFKVISKFYTFGDFHSDSYGDWAHIEYVWGWCNSEVADSVRKFGGNSMDETDFLLRLFSFVKMRGGKFHRFNQGIFVSARLPHKEKYRGARFPGGPQSTHSASFLPDDPRLIPALKKYGIDTTGLRLGGGLR